MAFPANLDSRELLEIEMATNLLMTESGRIQRLNTPDRRKAQRMVIAITWRPSYARWSPLYAR